MWFVNPRQYLIDFFKSIPKEDIEKFIDSGGSLASVIEERLNMLQSLPDWLRDFIIGLIRKEWDTIDYFLSDTDKVVKEIVSIRPDLAITFSKKHRREWLGKEIEKIRKLLYLIAWGY